MPPASVSTQASSSTNGLNESTAALAETIASTVSLLQTFLGNLRNLDCTSKPVPQDSPNALDVLHTAATLLKAHTTKISLLAVNRPFTPPAIQRIVSDVAQTCIPAMMSAVHLCEPALNGQILHDETKALVEQVYRALESLLQELLADLPSLSSDVNDKERPGESNLTSTGVLWGACDQVAALKGLKLVGLVVRKAKLYKSMVEDAMSELQEWGEDERNDDDDFGDKRSEDADHEDDMDENFGAYGRIPSDSPDIRAALVGALRKLKQIKSLYNSVLKYRLETIDTTNEQQVPGAIPLGDVACRVDRVMECLRTIPEQVDELAGAFYELDEIEADKLIKDVCKRGADAAEIMKLNWAGERDEFTTWAGVWQRLIDQA